MGQTDIKVTAMNSRAGRELWSVSPSVGLPSSQRVLQKAASSSATESSNSPLLGALQPGQLFLTSPARPVSGWASVSPLTKWG